MPRKPTAREQLTEYRRKRDFRKTAEPEGAGGGGGDAPKSAKAKKGAKAKGAAAKSAKAKSARTKKATSAKKTAKAALKLDFVIQKHAARNLHFDLRLELDGVMKSWAVPKGPAPDPSIKRLAMQVEDHPIEYNTFEGTIPEGEYGGGTVLLWDRGWYEPEKGGGEDGVREGIRKGDLKVIFHGKRMKGSWVLVRTRGWGGGGGGSSSKPSWLLIKHRDEHAESGDALVERFTTSVVSKKTLEQIGGSVKKRVWHSNRPDDDDGNRPAGKRTKSIAEVRAARAKATAKDQ